MFRLFVALSLPAEISNQLSTLQHGVEGARWRPIENFHVTLAFIGETDRHGFDAAHEALADITAPEFAMSLRSIDFIGNKKPRALWVGADGGQALEHLQMKVDSSLRQAGHDLEKRKFIPHVTLAYLRGARRDAVAAYCAHNGLFSTPTFRISEFHLYTSQLGSGASHYQIEQSYSLSSSK